jgi:putative SOS response-associated peptidase YedK
MCVNFTPAKPTAVQRMTGRDAVPDYPPESFPGYAAPIIRADADAGAVSGLKVDLASFGLIPGWAKDRSIGRRTYNARTETVAEKPSYRTAWRRRQLCLVPMERFFEPCWETGKAVRWSIHRQDCEPFTVAAIWDSWTDRVTGEIVESFSMLTINADGHPIMGRFHKPADERRSLVVVPQQAWQDWLTATADTARSMLTEMPVDQFISEVTVPPKPQLGLL